LPHGHYQPARRQAAVCCRQCCAKANPVAARPSPVGGSVPSSRFDSDRVSQAARQHETITGKTLFTVAGGYNADLDVGCSWLAAGDAGLRKPGGSGVDG
jgi:hypothetical protein